LKNVIKHTQRKILVVLLTFLMILAWQNLKSQEQTSSFFSTIYLEGSAHYGFLIPHHRELWALTDGFFPIWEFSIAKQTNGREPCQSLRKYPQLRLSYLYSDFGNSKSIGVMHAIVPNIRLPIIASKKIKLLFSFGLGAAHMSKKFHQTDNYKNLAIGTNFNAAIQFGLNLRFRLSDRVTFNPGFSMLHVSNGTIKTPNYGLNIPAAFANLSWKLNSKKIVYKTPEVKKEKKGNINLRISGLVSSKQILSKPDKDFYVFAGSLIISRYYNNLNTYLIGLDIIYDESTKNLMEQNDQSTDQWQDVTKLGLMAGHEWTFSKLGIMVGLGYYLQNNNEDDAPVYSKIGINYQVVKFAYLGISLRTHWAKADFLGAGIGFKF